MAEARLKDDVLRFHPPGFDIGFAWRAPKCR